MKLKINVHNWMEKWLRLLVDLGVDLASSAQRHSNKSTIRISQKAVVSINRSITDLKVLFEVVNEEEFSNYLLTTD